MAINKVDYGQKTLIDLTSDTVTKETLIKGETAHAASGEKIYGEFDPDVYLKKSGGDAKDVVSTFSSSDTDDSVSEWTSVSLLSSGEKLSSLFNKISTMFRNVRYLYKLIGSTDISELSEDGTITKSLTTLNGKLESIIVVSDSIDIEEIKASFSALGKKLASPKYAFQLIRAFHPNSGKCVDFFINADGNLYTTSQITSEFFGIWYINGCYVAK